MSEKSNSLWWPRYVGDYQRKTAHLSLAEHGAYALLLDHYYSTGKPLHANAACLHRVCRAFSADEQAAVQSVLDQFFTLEDDGYHNAKADEELLKRCSISEKRAKAAAAKHGKKYANASANAHTSTTTTTYIKNPQPPLPSEPTCRDGLGDEIDQVRTAVWRQAGLNEDAITTKLVSASAEGLRQARGWLEKFTIAEALAIITEAYDGAESRGDAIRRPWVYLDRVFSTKAEEKANPQQSMGQKADPWYNRRNLLEMGIWLDNYGARPGNVACDAPQWAQELFIANKHKRDGRAVIRTHFQNAKLANSDGNQNDEIEENE